MAETKDGGPAFPNRWANEGENEGMTLRDWFAGKAIPAIIAATSDGKHQPNIKDGEHIRFAIARDAYDMADAMLAAREGQGGGS